MPVKRPFKVAIAAFAIAGGGYLLHYGADRMGINIGKVLVPKHAQLGTVEDSAATTGLKQIPLPSSSPANVSATQVRQESWEWNAQMGELFANGGSDTTKGSLMAQHGVNLHIERQDDTTKMGEDLIACAKEVHDIESHRSAGDPPAQCSKGANLVVIMGDGAAQFAAGVNPQLAKLGPDYLLKVIGIVGSSRGEDAFMAPQSLKDDPKSISTTPMEGGNTTGMLVEGVIRDGDWNIALNWAGINNVPNNPDEHTFDKDALNWVNSADYNVAAADYVSGNKCEDRREVSHGKPTGKIVHVCVNGVVTWTPGDVTVATGRGGLTKIASSLEFRSQMPSVLIGSGHFLAANRTEIQSLLQASFEGGDQVKNFDSALHAAAAISSKIYGDEGAPGYTHGAYWYKYFHPVTQPDKQRLMVSLGGSAVDNLADNLIWFGMNPGTNDNFRSTYNVFRDIDLQQYPQMFASNGDTPLPDVKQVEDKSYLTGILLAQSNQDESGQQGAADVIDYSKQGTGQVLGSRDYSINFATGSATPLPDGIATLTRLKDQLATMTGKVQIDGYTDNTGSDSVNVGLSQRRANAVRDFLVHGGLPGTRFGSPQGHGSTDALNSNTTAVDKAANRRVHITIQQ
jgi:OmpA-OmpF porin, OOP family